jgi:hypothetical protein
MSLGTFKHDKYKEAAEQWSTALATGWVSAYHITLETFTVHYLCI